MLCALSINGATYHEARNFLSISTGDGNARIGSAPQDCYGVNCDVMDIENGRESKYKHIDKTLSAPSLRR